MIQLEKVIEKGSQNLGTGINVQWFKFADGTYLMAGSCQFTTTEDTWHVFNLTLPISLINPSKSACVVTNIYISRRICTWSATLLDSSTIRFDVEPADTTGAGVTLACSFILIGK